MKEKKEKILMILLLGAAGCACLLLLFFAHGSKAGYILAKESAGETTQRETETEAGHRTGQVTPQWLFYQSAAGSACDREWKKYMDSLVNQWTKRKLTDDEISSQMTEYLTKRDVEVDACAVQSEALCLFDSADSLPDYPKMLVEGDSFYSFIGVYTDGEYDAEGRLICYYWEAEVEAYGA